MEARVIRAEVLQKRGDLVSCREELNKVDMTKLTHTTSQGYQLIKAKLLMQQGSISRSKAALQSLKDKLGADSSSEINSAFLWRQAFVLALLGEKRESRWLAEEHRTTTLEGGFHAANNIIYAQVLPCLASTDRVIYSHRKWIEEIRRAGTFYVSSNVDFSGRLGHRGKSLCQALLVEAFILWDLGNRFDAYHIGFTAAVLLRHWRLDVTSEGVGEVVTALENRAAALTAAIKYVFSAFNDTLIMDRLAAFSDSARAEAAYIEGVVAAGEILKHPRGVDIYKIVDGAC